MSKNTRLITSIWLGSLFLLAIEITLAFIRFDSQDLKFSIADEIIWLSAIMMILMSILNAYLVIRILIINKKRKKFINLLLALYFLASSLVSLMQLFVYIFEISNENIWYNIDQSSFIFLGLSIISINYFVLEVFNEGVFSSVNNKRLFGSVLITTFVFAIVIELEALLLYEITLIPNIIFFMAAISFVLLALFSYMKLSFESYNLAKKLDESKEKRGFLFIAFSGIFLSLGLIVRLIPNALGIINIYIEMIAHGLFFIGYVSLFYGFTLPMKK